MWEVVSDGPSSPLAGLERLRPVFMQFARQVARQAHAAQGATEVSGPVGPQCRCKGMHRPWLLPPIRGKRVSARFGRGGGEFPLYTSKRQCRAPYPRWGAPPGGLETCRIGSLEVTPHRRSELQSISDPPTPPHAVWFGWPGSRPGFLSTEPCPWAPGPTLRHSRTPPFRR